MKIIINEKQYNYLNQFLLEAGRKDLMESLQNWIQNDKKFISIEKRVCNDIRDCAGERLQEIGFDKDYELTEEGEILEEIIDLFYV